MSQRGKKRTQSSSEIDTSEDRRTERQIGQLDKHTETDRSITHRDRHGGH